VRLEGSIDAFSLPDIFSLLSMTKKTGGLHLRREQAHGVVWFTTGAITGGSADVSRQALARRMVGAGLVDDNALSAAVERAAAEAIGVGRALHLTALLDDGTVHDVASEHIVDAVFDLLRWNDGDFAFVVDEANPDDVGVSRSVEDVVTEARRRLEAWTTMTRTAPAPGAVLAMSPAPSNEPQLSTDEWALLSLVDGRRTVAEIVDVSGRGDFTVVSALADLVSRGLLHVADGAEAAGLVRRAESLRVFEHGNAPVDVEPALVPVQAEPEPEPEPAAPIRPRAEPHADDAAVTQLKAAAPRTEVTPARPEPFLPQRQPDHPEEPVAVPMAAAGGGGAAAAPAASPLIERDPSVNKSLLLRLIAGVRGL
jgi:hypothetical protein